MTQLRLWLPVVLGPFAWLAYLQTAYALIPWACRRPPGAMVTLQLVGVLALAISTAALLAAWRSYPRVDGAGRTRVLALAGLGTSAVFVLIVIGGVLPLALLMPCD